MHDSVCRSGSRSGWDHGYLARLSEELGALRALYPCRHKGNGQRLRSRNATQARRLRALACLEETCKQLLAEARMPILEPLGRRSSGLRLTCYVVLGQIICTHIEG